MARAGNTLSSNGLLADLSAGRFPWCPLCVAAAMGLLLTPRPARAQAPESTADVDLGVAVNRAVHTGDRASSFVYPTLGAGLRIGLFRMQVRTQLPFLLLDGAAYIVQFASGHDPNKLPMSSGLNGGTSRMGPVDFLEGDFFLAPWRKGPQRLDVGLRLSLRLMDYVNEGVGVSAQWFGAYPSAGWQMEQGPTQLSITGLAGPAWSSHGPGGAAGGECMARWRLGQRVGLFTRVSLMGQWLDARHDYPYGARPGEGGRAGWFLMSNATAGLTFRM